MRSEKRDQGVTAMKVAMARNVANVSTRITCEVDLDKEGMQHGYLRVPYSSPESAYGWIPVPIAVFANGNGPSVLLMAGNHGDEFEGQIALIKLLKALDVTAMRGRVIILPTANFPAAVVGQRNSPLDGGNLNRCFPGDLNGSPTQMIAHFIEHFIMSRCDYSIDLHSGGASLLYVPCILARYYADVSLREALDGLIASFGAPYAALFRPIQGETRTMSAAAERAGIPHLNMELGGACMIDRSVLGLTESGVRNILRHLGVLSDAPPAAPKREVRRLMLKGSASYLYSPANGHFEPFADIHEEVKQGQPAGAIHFPDMPWKKETVLEFAVSGVVLCRRVQGWTRLGDCLFQVASAFDASAM
jgi:predicted deacylase